MKQIAFYGKHNGDYAGCFKMPQISLAWIIYKMNFYKCFLHVSAYVNAGHLEVTREHLKMSTSCAMI
jgi:hypothetical protein